MKLIIQIPCFNEENTLPETVRNIPRNIPGVDKVEILIIDDGSTDRTVETARRIGVDHIIRNVSNKGLAQTFITGLDACLKRGADIIVNTDGDNQYKGEDIKKLVAPILDGNAEMVIGDRETGKVKQFSRLKKFLQKTGSAVVSKLAGVEIPDAVSGFRAFSRKAAIRMNVISSYSYTIETVIQAGKKNLTVVSVPIRINPKTRESRLFTSIPEFISSQLSTMLRTYVMYQPMRTFSYIGITCILVGLIPSVRFLFYYFSGKGGGAYSITHFCSDFIYGGISGSGIWPDRRCDFV